jgi:hypothetical protein
VMRPVDAAGGHSFKIDVALISINVPRPNGILKVSNQLPDG